MPDEQPQKHNDAYALVTDRIIAHLEKGVIPWRQPWFVAGVPRNLVSNKPYRGINVLLLASLGYEQNYFLTFRQVQELGGHVNKGERSHEVIFWNWKEYEDKETGKKEKIPLLRYYRVFNIAQCEDIQKEKLPQKTEQTHKLVQACEELIAQMPKRPPICHEKQEAYYHPVNDYINMPRPETFVSTALVRTWNFSRPFFLVYLINKNAPLSLKNRAFCVVPGGFVSSNPSRTFEAGRQFWEDWELVNRLCRTLEMMI